MSVQDIIKLIDEAAQEAGIDPNLVQAISSTESHHNPWAVRYEPFYKYLYFAREHADRLGVSVDTEITMQKCSWGLMQIMGGVARELGYGGPMPQLCDPSLSLKYGIMHLKSKLVKYGIESDAVSAYNQGSPRKTPGMMYQNQGYVDKVYSVLNNLRKL